MAGARGEESWLGWALRLDESLSFRLAVAADPDRPNLLCCITKWMEFVVFPSPLFLGRESTSLPTKGGLCTAGCGWRRR